MNHTSQRKKNRGTQKRSEDRMDESHTENLRPEDQTDPEEKWQRRATKKSSSSNFMGKVSKPIKDFSVPK